MPRLRTPLADRFWLRVDKAGPLPLRRPELGPCWLWTGSRDRAGYGTVKQDGRIRGTHRLAYELVVGPIPDGLELDHLCRTRACARPDHLEPVTRRVNQLRGDAPSALNAVKEFCVHGHRLGGDNIKIRRDAPHQRECLACKRERNRLTARRARARRATLPPTSTDS